MRRATAMPALALSATVLVAPSAASPALQRAWRASPESLGLVLGAGLLGSALAALVGVGVLSRIGSRRATGLATAGLAASYLAFVASSSAAPAAVAAIGVGASAGLLEAATQGRHRARGTEGDEALDQLAFVLGTIAGPLAVAWIVHTALGWRGPFIGLALVAGALGVSAWRPGIRRVRPSDLGGVDTLGATVSGSTLVTGCCAAASVGAPIVLSSWLVYYLVMAARLDWLTAAVALSLFWGSIAAGRVAFPWVAWHVPSLTLLWSSTLIAAAACGCLPFMPDRGWTFVAIAVAGVASAPQFATIAAWLGSRESPDPARVSALVATAADCWAAAGAFGLGVIAARSPSLVVSVFGRATLRVHDLGVGILALAGVMLFLALYFRAAARGTRRAPRQEPDGDDAGVDTVAAAAV